MASSSEATTTHETLSEEEKRAIEAQLERLLANPHFSNSRRFPSFLRYIVKATINGQADLLKERTLGIEIFGKDPDYDTAVDPIVRVTAAEIRKRIAQYYQDPGHEDELRLTLAPGSYVPQFHPPTVVQPISEPGSTADSAPLAVLDGSHGRASGRSSSWLPWALVPTLCVLLLGIAAFIGWRHNQRSAFAEFWDPILSSSEPVLFCVADQTQYTAISLRDASNPERQVTLNDNLTAVVIDDLSTITKIAGVLQSAGKPYSLRGENATSLMDLRNGPSVIIGAFDNAWTLRMLRPLRFHFANNADMTMFSIVDGSQPGRTQWVVDRRQQIATNNYRDFAIVALFTDDTTGKPTLVAAGIGRGGTIAAGEFLTNPDLLKAVRNQRPSTKAKNVEVVLSTQIIDGEPGTPKIEAVYFW
ncbi:MAG: hypothetical protein ABR957_15940 [Terracidiphilus sp.]|jgi:hypothetical protein